MMKLPGDKVNQIHKALIERFSEGELQIFVRAELEENIENIAGGETHSDIVFNLIQWAERNKRIGELVKKAYLDSPNNSQLKELDLYIEKWDKDEKNVARSIKNQGQINKISLPIFNTSLIILSFLSGLVTGIALFALILFFNRPPLIFDPLIEPAVSATVIAKENENTLPDLEVIEVGSGLVNREGEHYKLRANFNYLIKVITPTEQSEESRFIWDTTPDDFIEIPSTTDPEIKITAPFDKIDSSGKIRVCVRETGGKCRKFTTEDISVLIIK